MDAPRLKWRNLEGNEVNEFNALTVDAGMESAQQVFCIWNNYNPTDNSKADIVVEIKSSVTGSTLAGKYFDVSSVKNRYRVWFNLIGAGTPVPPTGIMIPIKVDVNDADNAATIATAVKTALEANENAQVDFAISVSTNTIRLIPTIEGTCQAPSTQLSDLDTIFSFTFTQGSGGVCSDAINMSLTATDVLGFDGIASGQITLKVQFAKHNPGFDDLWGYYDDSGNFVIDGYKEVGGAVSVPLNSYAGTKGTLKGDWNAAYNTHSLRMENLKDNYAKVKLIVVVKPTATAGQLDFYTRATYSYS